MKEIFLVFAGGGLGSVARFFVGKIWVSNQLNFPIATLTANFLSCFVFGLVLILGVEKINLTLPLKLLIITGFCGGFSTYSAFTFETVELFKTGQTALAFSNILLNLVLSICALYLGITVAKFF
ncbi:MAG TPA: fluoride efflux transporter CrcB [Sphingobacteriaceae bacterium]|nr:fluoride efflux transporter CrcB [Sphingobacteriaceae bacterium]